MLLKDRSDLIWIDGQYIPWQDAYVHVLTHTLHYGMGVFEGVRAYKTEQGSVIFRLHDHTSRLFQSAKIMGMNIPYSKEELNIVQQTILKKNHLPSAYIRPMVFYGPGHLGLQTENLTTHVIVAAVPWGTYFGDEKIINGIKIKTSSFTRTPSNSVLSKAKANGNYVNSILALQEARACGCDDALLLDAQGCVSEGSGANIFIVRKGVLLTPEPSSILEGITRETVMTLAVDLGVVIKEKRITREEIYIADEVFFTGTAAEITPIREVDNRIIGTGRPGKITQDIQKLYADLVRGKYSQHQDWLTSLNT